MFNLLNEFNFVIQARAEGPRASCDYFQVRRILRVLYHHSEWYNTKRSNRLIRPLIERLTIVPNTGTMMFTYLPVILYIDGLVSPNHFSKREPEKRIQSERGKQSMRKLLELF